MKLEVNCSVVACFSSLLDITCHVIAFLPGRVTHSVDTIHAIVVTKGAENRVPSFPLLEALILLENLLAPKTRWKKALGMPCSLDIRP